MSAPTRAESPPQRPNLEGVPPLRSGDRLTRAEFERRYDAMPSNVKAELIEGVVYVASPISAEDHGEPHADVMGWLWLYHAFTPGVRAGDNSSLRLDLDNMPQPDAYLRIEEAYGGQTRMINKYVEGGPELVAEIAASSASYDLHDKLNVYRRNGVREYIVWRTWDAAIDWFVLREGLFEQLEVGTDGIYRSEVLPGLWLDPDALIRSDALRVHEVAQMGISSQEHQEFEQLLHARAQAPSFPMRGK